MDEPLRQAEPPSFPDIPPRDYILALDMDFNIDAQLMAIRGLLHRNRKEDQKIKNEIEQIEEHARRLKGIHAEWAIDDWADRIHHSAYQDAAHSMSALGMLAPLIETVFYQCFRGIGKRFYPPNYLSNEHERWKATHAIQWDCHMFVSGNRVEEDIVRGIIQLADAVGLASKLPSDLKLTLLALFGYRNKMFHCGLEWPVEERDRFAKRMCDEGWPSDWFIQSTTDDKPWIFYLSDKFIEHCMSTVEQVLNAIGAFVRDKLLPKQGI